VLPPGYLSAVYGVMRDAGVTCIADEVQTGFGRTGLMWAFTQQGVVPDIVTLGKPMGEWLMVEQVLTCRAVAAGPSTIIGCIGYACVCSICSSTNSLPVPTRPLSFGELNKVSSTMPGQLLRA
jgi:hypothetical protein